MDDDKFRGLELWDAEEVPPGVLEAAIAAALAVLDKSDVSPLEARYAQFSLEAMDDRGELDDGSDLAAGGVNEAHLNAGRRAEAAASEIIEQRAPGCGDAYLRLGIAEWALEQFQATGIDPTKPNL
ncbi:hypothetical protein [Sphingopyxis sp. KK2]|uniref:hypothetical protein n=1 Tax=Sphingopyxis sp. KK2 TaxID=1855727 RepID=UPI00097E70CA|nr:hypothetical protein [Sphingopyxis sp. KK2]